MICVGVKGGALRHTSADISGLQRREGLQIDSNFVLSQHASYNL